MFEKVKLRVTTENMITKRSSFSIGRNVTFPRARFDSDTAFSGSMLLRKHTGALAP